MLFIQLTGMSGTGKSTLSAAIKEKLELMNLKVEIIDGDVYRKTLCKDLGFSKEDRHENIRRLGNMGIQLAKEGTIAILSAINPYECIRQELKKAAPFVKTVWIRCSLDTLLQRDTKGLYKRALLPDGHPQKITNLTGVNDPFDEPLNPDLVINTDNENLYSSTHKLFEFIVASLPVKTQKVF